MQCPVKFDSYDSLSLSLPSTFQVCFQFCLLNALFLVTCFDHPSQIINKICTLQVTFEVHEGYCLSWIIMCVKGLIYCLSQDRYLDIDHNVSSTNCRSSSGDSVNFLSRTICTDYLHQTYMKRVNLPSTNFLACVADVVRG